VWRFGVIAHVCTRPANEPRSSLQFLSGAELTNEPLSVDGGDLVWVDIVSPQSEDITWLRSSFGFHQLALEDVALRHQRPKLQEYPGYYFGVLYAVEVRFARPRVRVSELQFFWGPTYFVTIHTVSFPEIDNLAHRARAAALRPTLQAAGRPLQISDLVYRLIDSIVDAYFPAVDVLADLIEDLEEQMFRGDRRSGMLETIFTIRKDLMQVRKVVAPSREVINAILRRDLDLYGDELYPYFQDAYDHVVRAVDSLDTYRDVLGSALDTQLSISSNEVNQTVKRMTALTTILMVNSLVAGIYGMNFVNMPELEWKFGYAWALGLMVVASVLLWRVFKRIHWF
jgi:magnesium transporter